jgi:hypothetical protein
MTTTWNTLYYHHDRPTAIYIFLMMLDVINCEGDIYLSNTHALFLPFFPAVVSVFICSFVRLFAPFSIGKEKSHRKFKIDESDTVESDGRPDLRSKWNSNKNNFPSPPVFSTLVVNLLVCKP